MQRTKGDGLPPEERSALASAASSEVERIARLVDDLLALARTDASQEIARRPVELDRVLLDVFRNARVLNGDSGPGASSSKSSGASGKVKPRISGIDQLQVTGDPDRLRQLLLGLADNALKYTQPGGEVALGLRREGDWAVVEVNDTGIGISEDDLPRVFERFYRADKAWSRDLGGTGLGLAIARWIAEEHGGEIRVESTLGRGTAFTVRPGIWR